MIRLALFQAIKLGEVVWILGAMPTAVVVYTVAGFGWAVVAWMTWPFFVGWWLARGWLLPLLRANGLV
jgi:hypothetical protein